MFELIAQGIDPAHRWRRKLTAGQRMVVGRTGAWAVPWDERISRRHFEARLEGETLTVEVSPAARNPVFYRGRKSTEFSIGPGEHFVIGGTTFTLANEQIVVSLVAPLPDGERTFAPEELRAPFRRTDERIEALSRLPAIIHHSATEEELFGGLVQVLLAGVPWATGVAIVAVTPGNGAIEVLHWDRPTLQTQPLSPSERLIRSALEQQASVVHVWSAGSPRAGNFTIESGIDWALCVPLCQESSAEWGAYLTGRFDDQALHEPEALKDEVKFAELAAETFRSLRQLQRLTRQQGALAQFLSPPVLNYIRGEDFEALLAPREVDVSILFCDLRGFSLESERLAGKLPELLDRVSRSLGVMSRQILASGGVVGDFHGDAAMGFWGWPLPMDDAPLRACRAALAIRREFLAADWRSVDEPSDFRIGIGVATGRAVAGKIGTVEQVKVTVLGPAVNLAARLETLTKTIRAPILIDGPTAAFVQQSGADFARTRQIAKVRPTGMSTVVDLHELLPPAAELPELPAADLQHYAAAWQACAAGDWTLAAARLQEVSSADRVREFLAGVVANPPAKWEGVIEL